MKTLKITALVGLVVLVSACEDAAFRELGPDKTIDRGIDSKHLSQLQAGIWVDPNGCDHWIIDDGVEGYLSARLDKYGKPVCSGVAPPTYTAGDFKKGATSLIGDPI
ncbi:hypothetical protein [Sulfitobacter guttiformis]|uniref:Lipoprotein n=1 Tax=Sulfitobacter guttiformis TaxID=74349 RepID=A0A420DPZ9_9RHOB|nr:hypothetical protein [Sulfitobacter guttiformis]KIN73591.1 putative lipoprotein [Sulfitobacter guttiformis KCTC 32187]RKE96239.1 hypothetical protein C8N30_0796 [Sulfitobacter guttiformis]